MNKKNIQLIPSIILYIFAGLLVVYAIWAYTICADIISQAKAAGQLAASGNEYDIASFYMGNCAQYFVYAILLAAAGLILQRKPTLKSEPGIIARPSKAEAADMELDEWFDETESTDSK